MFKKPKTITFSDIPLKLKLEVFLSMVILLTASPFIYRFYKIQEAKPNFNISKNYFGDYQYQTKNKDYQVSFLDKKDESKPWVNFKVGTDEIKMGLDSANAQNFQVGNDKEQKKDQLLIQEVIPQTDLTYEIIPEGLKEEIVLKNKEAIQKATKENGKDTGPSYQFIRQPPLTARTV